MSSMKHTAHVAIVGARGNVGRAITAALLRTGQHVVTAISRRSSSESSTPEDVQVRRVADDYGDAAELQAALAGQSALVILLSRFAAPGAEKRLIAAAAAAGVHWVLPCEFGPDTFDETLIAAVPMFRSKVEHRQLIRDLGVSSFVSIITGFWYEWMLAVPPAFGFDPARRSVTFIDDGKTEICLSTWSQIGRAVAGLLSLPAERPGSGGGEDDMLYLSDFRNAGAYVYSFAASQRDMLESAGRIGNGADWTVEAQEPAEVRYKAGKEEAARGKRSGLAKVMATPVFYHGGAGDFRNKPAPFLLNKSLSLPEEDRESFDRATFAALDQSIQTNNWND